MPVVSFSPFLKEEYPDQIFVPISAQSRLDQSKDKSQDPLEIWAMKNLYWPCFDPGTVYASGWRRRANLFR